MKNVKAQLDIDPLIFLPLCIEVEKVVKQNILSLIFDEIWNGTDHDIHIVVHETIKPLEDRWVSEHRLRNLLQLARII